MLTRLTSMGTLMSLLALGLATISPASDCMYPFATEIITSTPIVNNTPEDVLGAPDGIAADFDSDGSVPSTVVVGFSSAIVNREGNDFSISYVDLPESQRQESSEILVKNQTYDFTRIGTIEPTLGLKVRRVFQVKFFDLDTLGWTDVTQVMVRNLASPYEAHEGLDIDGFTAIHCDGDTPSDAPIAIHTSGLLNTEATCWNRTTNDLLPASKDSDGKHSCANLFTSQGDSIWLTIGGDSHVGP